MNDKKQTNEQIINEYTFNKFLPLWENNLSKTINKIRYARSILGLKDYFKNKSVPAVIIGGGPSLDKKISLLKKYKNQAITICSDIVYKNIAKYYFQPDFCVTIDAQPEIETFVKNTKKTKTLLVAPTVTFPGVIKNWNGNRAFYNIKFENDYCMNIDINKNIPINVWLPTGNIVGNFAAVFALFLGCNPIILVGNDMAFTNLKCYSNLVAKNNHLKTNKFNSNETYDISYITDQENLVIMKDIYGKDIYSRRDYIFYYNWLSKNLFNHIMCANCTEGGIVKTPIVHNFEPFIAPYPIIDKPNFYNLTKSNSSQKKIRFVL